MNKPASGLPGYVQNLPQTGNAVFNNWVTLDPQGARIFRSSQPYYNGNVDTPPYWDSSAVALLQQYAIAVVISLNHNAPYTLLGCIELTNAGIIHIHLPVVDFGTPTNHDLILGCTAIQDAIAKGHNVLIHCGFGEGRTGTMWTAWQIYNLPRNESSLAELNALIEASTAETAGQETRLRLFAQELGVGEPELPEPTDITLPPPGGKPEL